MFTSFVLIALVLVQARPEKVVTAAEKQAFLKLLESLPVRGEFFTDEGVATAVPFTRVLFSLTENDLKDRDLYPFLALSSGLMSHKESREEAIKNFEKIAHPTVKLFWGALLIKQPDPPLHIRTFMKKALDSPVDSRTLAQMAGPGFPAFRKAVNDAFERGRRDRVELVTRHQIEKLPEFGGAFDYDITSLLLSPKGTLHAIRPLEDHGELFAHDLQAGKRHTHPVRLPPGINKEQIVGGTFNSPLKLARNSRGDILCSWTIQGNGDHGLGLLKADAAAVDVKHVELHLYEMMIVDDQAGGWLLVVGGPQLTVFRVEADLGLTALGSFEGEGRHSMNALDACMIAPNVLHFFWGEEIQGNHLRLRCVDFDLQRKTWLHDRVVQRNDPLVSLAHRTRIVQLADKSLHYVWSVDPGAEKTKSAGTYCHSETNGKTNRIADGYEFAAVPCATRLVICTTEEAEPNKVSFRVIHNGTVHPPTEIMIAENRKEKLSLDYMALAADADRIWFMNTLATDAVYELRLGNSDGRVEK